MKTNRIKQETRQVRRSADIIALTALMSVFINYLLYPVIGLLPAAADGSLYGETRELVLYVVIFAVPFLAASRLSGMSLRALAGQGRPGAEVYLMTLGLALGWSIAAGWLGVGIEEMLNGCGLTEVSSEYVLPDSAAALAVQFVSTAIVPPIVEELCYRGFYLNTALRAMDAGSAIILTSVCFWMAHDSLEIFPLAFGFGLLGGYIRRRYGSILPSMCAHFAVNSVYILVNASYALGEPAGTVISVAVELIELALGAVGLLLFVRRKEWRRVSELGNSARGSLTAGQITAAVLTSVPMLVLIALTIYFTQTYLEVL